MPKPEKKGVEQNHYTDHITQNHLILREKVEALGERIPHIQDSAEFEMEVLMTIRQFDSIMMVQHQIEMGSRKDTLVDASSGALIQHYTTMLMIDYKELYAIYSGVEGSPDSAQQAAIDSIWTGIQSRDEQSLNTFFENAQLEGSVKDAFKILGVKD